MKIEITPLDTVFFKDAKPFNILDESWADSLLLPYPSVIYGALRSVYFSNHIDEFSNLKDKDPTENLIIKNISYSLNKYPCYPLPKSIVKLKKTEKDEFIQLLPQKSKFISSCSLLGSFCVSNLQVEEIKNGYIDAADLEKFLKCKLHSSNRKLEGLEIENLDDYITSENKIGIKMDKNTNSVKKEYLYRINMLRLRNIKINVEFEGINIPYQGFIKLGGEGRSLYYEEIDNDFSCYYSADTTNKVVFYLSTPVIFEKGWLPNWINEDTLEGEYKENGVRIKLKLITACLGRPEYIGGYDIKNKCPKPMRKAIPAGSVYYFEVEEGSKKDIVQLFHNKSISEYDTAKEGFGITYVGSWEA